jgi:hypothetical protein
MTAPTITKNTVDLVVGDECTLVCRGGCRHAYIVVSVNDDTAVARSQSSDREIEFNRETGLMLPDAMSLLFGLRHGADSEEFDVLSQSTGSFFLPTAYSLTAHLPQDADDEAVLPRHPLARKAVKVSRRGRDLPLGLVG